MKIGIKDVAGCKEAIAECRETAGKLLADAVEGLAAADVSLAQLPGASQMSTMLAATKIIKALEVLGESITYMNTQDAMSRAITDHGIGGARATHVTDILARHMCKQVIDLSETQDVNGIAVAFKSMLTEGTARSHRHLMAMTQANELTRKVAADNGIDFDAFEAGDEAAVAAVVAASKKMDTDGPQAMPYELAMMLQQQHGGTVQPLALGTEPKPQVAA